MNPNTLIRSLSTLRIVQSTLVAVVFLCTLGLGARNASAMFGFYPGLGYEFYRGNSISDWKQTDAQVDIGRFGGGYYLGAYIRAKKESRFVEVDASANVMLFGQHAQVASINAHGRADSNGGFYDASMYVMGKEIFHEAGSSFSHDQAISVTFIEVKQTFWLAGFIPLSLKMTGSGQVGIAISGNAQPSQLSATVTPSVGVTGSLGLGLDAVIAAFWVTGNVKLVNVAVPVTATVSAADGANLAWGLDIDLVISTLDGYLSFDWEAVGGVFKGSEKLFEWAGLSWTYRLMSLNGAEAF